MILFRHELRKGRRAWAAWTAGVAAFVAICICIFPDMKGQMTGLNAVFSAMGAFTKAFGMDRLNFGTLIGFYAVECAAVVGMGGAFYAATTAACALSREEERHTAEFLLAHPIRRTRVLAEKLCAILALVTALNIVTIAVSAGTIAAIGESIPWQPYLRLHAALYLMQLEFACVCFGMSAFLRRGGMGQALGLVAALYFANLVANISPSLSILKAISPFGYADGADIVTDGALNGGRLLIGAALSAAGIAAAFLHYPRKDIT